MYIYIYRSFCGKKLCTSTTSNRWERVTPSGARCCAHAAAQWSIVPAAVAPGAPVVPVLQ